MLRFESPWMFLLLLVIPVLLYLRSRRAARAAVRYSSLESARQAGRSLRQRLIALPVALRTIALILMTIALARPQLGTERVRDISRGIAIEMVVDRSSSMGGELSYRGKRMTRLDVVKDLFKQFVDGDGRNLKGRASDMIGMITFARYADTICPLTLAHGALSGFLPNVKLVDDESEDGTAIGDAVALAAARLQTAEDAISRQTGETRDYEIKSKVIILLTDGENNAGERTVEDAAELAAEWGIKVYVIGVGGGEVLRTPFGSYSIPGRTGVDEEVLKVLADRTGGLLRVASNAEALRSIYEEIDRLEKSEIETTRFLDYRELFSNFALCALALLALETLLACTWLRRLP